MVSPAKKRYEQIRAAREAAAAESLKKAQQEAEAKDQERAEAPAKERLNPYNRGEGGKPRPSPARKHFDRARAKAEASQATPARPQGDAYELHKAAIVEDIRRLSDIQSIERKIEAKRELLPNYESYVQGVLEGGKGQQDDVLMTLMVWYLDVGDLKTGLDIAEYAVNHELETPDRYDRKTANLVAEEVADFALKLPDGDESKGQVLEQLHRTVEYFADADMHDQVKAKLFKALGYLERDAGDKETALLSLKRALELNDRIGVKKDIQALEKELQNSGQ
ncbi:phage terminase small subunit [Marinobacter salsuginis]|uniref:phage terminase small subunit n=1 Tax=Marinobacter salsuginis TaxID=418719 RepID=UPI001ADF982C|nr:phage terminase small subunit [Marinobacter salsuginis]QTN40905.1 terminase [Marinobacter salsuginis]